MGLEFYGLENINENVVNACTEFLKKQGVSEGKVVVEVVGKKGDNYIARVRRFVVQNDHEAKPFRMIVKIAPSDGKTRKMIQIVTLFKNESLIYNELLPKYKQFEQSAAVPEECKLRLPVCYGIHLEAPHECIALEDLNESGFYIANRLKSLTEDEVKLIISDLAKFHALGFVFRVRENGAFEKLKSGLQNTWSYYETAEEFKAYMKFLETQVESVLDENDFKERLKGILPSFATLAVDMHESDLYSESTIIIQGDCWTNNLLFKREGATPVEAVMLDYQLSRISSPAVDLHYLIFNCTDSETRNGRYSEWLDYYYDNFTKYIAFYDLKASDVYSRYNFNVDLQKYAKYSLALTLMLASMLVRESEEALDFKEEGIDATEMNVEKQFENLGVSNMKEATFRRFKERVRGVVKDFISYGYI
ncbi:hypothetical protein EVAR_48852_1 [Eumeta japonica]|uniref:CHK kinase-like domain-containing protein n=1 Tax=Eumeta variegata TaxID=151549 RepID=A0A4C1YA79_EUMVA|nr:hypothetical protein EVAR_48852_1 [Eumeta japonica]